jgi:uncharacterized protein
MKILIMGVSVRAMAESAVASGYQVVGLDAFGDLDLQTMCECHSLRRDYLYRFSAEGLFKASRGLSFDSVVYTANLENHPSVVGRLAQNAVVLGNSKEVLKQIRDWPSLFAALNRSGFRTPETLLRADIRPPDPTRKWLVKPVRGGGGHRIAFWRDGKKVSQDCMLQEYIPGISCSASFVSNGHEAVIIGLTEQLIGAAQFGGRDFNYCGNLIPLEIGKGLTAYTHILEQVQRIATLLTREFGLVGVNGMDFILADGQVCLLEVNPRFSSSMELIERAYRLPVFDLHVRAITAGVLPDFDLVSKSRSPGNYFAKAILYAEKDGRAPKTQVWIERGIRDVPHTGEKLSRGKPICTLLADGTTRDECYARLAADVERLKGEIYA